MCFLLFFLFGVLVWGGKTTTVHINELWLFFLGT